MQDSEYTFKKLCVMIVKCAGNAMRRDSVNIQGTISDKA